MLLNPPPPFAQRTVDFALSDKQLEAYDVLTLEEWREISELVFGGGARGGKSFLGSFWIITSSLKMPQSNWLIAREELKALKRTTLRTFFKVLGLLQLKKDIHYSYNAQDMVLTFINGSTVFFSELKRIPSDPEFDRIGSYDLTGAWLDESQEITKDAKDALQFRFTVLTGPGWNTTPKTLYTCNPAKTWIYSDFWKPIIKEGQVIEGRHFITSLYIDNPYIDHERYKSTVLRTNNKVKIQRLLQGNFEYDDSPNKIFIYDCILDMFHKRVNLSEPDEHGKRKEEGTKYLVCDVARSIDRIVIGYFVGLQLKKVFVYRNKKIPETAQELKDLAEMFGVSNSNIIVDADGMGVGVFDMIKNAKGFHNGGSPIYQQKIIDKEQDAPFANLKTQCYFLLSDLVNDGLIGIDTDAFDDDKDKEMLIEELDVVKQIKVDNDGKIQIESKDKVKEILGRSPDIADMMMMRMFYELAIKPRVRFYAI